jgi:lipopolysaccharide transport system permease protein
VTVSAAPPDKAEQRGRRSPDEQLQVIEPRRPGAGERLRELRAHRGLLRFFAVRATDKVVRRTVLGRAWLFLRPLLDVGSRVLIFGGLLGVPSGGVPYFVFFLAGMTAWALFENTLVWATRSLELNRKLLQKVYFPRIILPVASAAPALYELVVYGCLLAIVIALYSALDGTLYLNVGPELIAAVAALALSGAFALAIGLWTSVWGANTRDVRYSLLYVLGFWFFVTPVIYPLDLVPDGWRFFAELNPMTPIVELFKWGLVGAGDVEAVPLAITIAMTVAIAIGGLWNFGRAEAAAVDRL